MCEKYSKKGFLNNLIVSFLFDTNLAITFYLFMMFKLSNSNLYKNINLNTICIQFIAFLTSADHGSL